MAESSDQVKLKVKRIGVFSLAMYFMILYLILGVAVGIFYAIVLTIISGIAGNLNIPFSSLLGVAGPTFSVMGFAIVVLVVTVGMAVLGFIMGALMALMYNLVSRLTGGVEIKVLEIETQQPEQKQTQQAQQPQK